jgi:hypothetical protein
MDCDPERPGVWVKGMEQGCACGSLKMSRATSKRNRSFTQEWGLLGPPRPEREEQLIVTDQQVPSPILERKLTQFSKCAIINPHPEMVPNSDKLANPSIFTPDHSRYKSSFRLRDKNNTLDFITFNPMVSTRKCCRHPSHKDQASDEHEGAARRCHWGSPSECFFGERCT